MGRAVQHDWGFTEEVTRRVERDGRPTGKPGSGRRHLSLPATGAAHLGGWLTVVAVSLIGLVALHVVILQKNMAYTELIQEKGDLSAANARLATEVSALSSPERIDQIATKSLGMVPPGKMQYVYIGPATTQGSYAELQGLGVDRVTPP
ncbi:MAG: cell division protein FtsL [Chloroflexi bacterium]|nr:cell division protein FtsL [Chloroflexota bacterium]